MLITKGKWEVVLPSYPKNAKTLICVGDKLIATINNSQEVPPPESDRNAEAIVTAVNSTYGAGIDPLAVTDLLKAVEIALWALDNGETEAQRQGKPRLAERYEIFRNAIQKAKLK